MFRKPRTRRPTSIPVYHDVKIEVDGKQLAGTYTTTPDEITVRYGRLSKSAWINSRSHPESLAKLLLIELVGKSQRTSD
jgi:hypothetical protein